MPKVFSILPITGLFCLIFTSWLVADGGVDLFVRACQFQGHNPAMIYSGYANIEMETITKPPTQSEIEREIQWQIDRLSKSGYARLDEEQAIKDIRRVEESRFHKRIRASILFSGNESDHGKRRLEMSTYEPLLEVWEKPVVSLTGQYQKSTASVLSVSGVQQVNILDRELGLADFHVFGRMRGMPSRLASVAMLDGTSPDRFVFTENGIQKFKNEVAVRAKAVGGTFLIESHVEYDENAVAAQVVVRVGNIKAQEYWIDASRGYVVPKIIFYDNGRIKEEYKATQYFLHVKTGLWFPEKYEEIEYDPKSGDVVREKKYRIDTLTFRLNERVADEEFSLDIPEQYKVVDNRKNRRAPLKIPGVLTRLKKGVSFVDSSFFF